MEVSRPGLVSVSRPDFMGLGLGLVPQSDKIFFECRQIFPVKKLMFFV